MAADPASLTNDQLEELIDELNARLWAALQESRRRAGELPPTPPQEFWHNGQVLPSAPGAAQAAQRRGRVVARAGVNIRSAPSTSAPIVGRLEWGADVALAGESVAADGWEWAAAAGGWVAIRQPGGVGLLLIELI